MNNTAAMDRSVYNLHNHTPFSDGALTIDEICEAHLALADIRVDGVGICDHLFATPTSREVTSERDFERIFAAEARNYVSAVLEARQRWAGRMKIFCGCEINWPLNRHMLGKLKELLSRLDIDYVLFEYVDWAGLTQLANQVRKWPCPVGLAHTDVAAHFPNTSMDQVIRTLANARIFYEVNSKFLPLAEDDKWFAILPNHRVRVTIGTDTHDDLRCLKDLSVMHGYLARRRLLDQMLIPTPRQAEAVVA